jgi:hypothetical protein
MCRHCVWHSHTGGGVAFRATVPGEDSGRPTSLLRGEASQPPSMEEDEGLPSGPSSNCDSEHTKRYRIGPGKRICQENLPRVLLLNRWRKTSRHSYRVRLDNRESGALKVGAGPVYCVEAPAGHAPDLLGVCLVVMVILCGSNARRLCMLPRAVFPSEACA